MKFNIENIEYDLWNSLFDKITDNLICNLEDNLGKNIEINLKRTIRETTFSIENIFRNLIEHSWFRAIDYIKDPL